MSHDQAARWIRAGAFGALGVVGALVALAQAHSDRESLAISYVLIAFALLVGALAVYTLGELAHTAGRLADALVADAALEWLTTTLPLLALTASVCAWLVCARLLSSLTLSNASLGYALSVLGVVHALLVSLDAPLLVSVSGAMVAMCALVLPTRATSLYVAPSLGSAARPLLTLALGYVLTARSGDTTPPGAYWDASSETAARHALGWATRWALARALRVLIQCVWLLYAHLFLAPLALAIVVANCRQQQRRIRVQRQRVADVVSLSAPSQDDLESGERSPSIKR